MGVPAKKRLDVVQQSGEDSDILRNQLREVESHDLVLAVTGYVGSGASFVASVFKEHAETNSFDVVEVRLSELIAEACSIERPPKASTSITTELQDGGDGLRQRCGNSIVAGLAVRKMAAHRKENPPKNGTPRLYIIDSIKHPDEVEILRTVYGSSFYLVAAIANEPARMRRLRVKYKGSKPEDLLSLAQRDCESGRANGQKVRKTLQLADFFVANDSDEEHSLGDSISRFLDAVTGRIFVRPTADERGMHAAWSAALRSSCLSRQVGAAIVGRGGTILATGTNDPPQVGGGLYTEGSQPDNRCFRYLDEKGAAFCRNDRKKQEIYREVFEKLRGLLGDSAQQQDIQRALEATRIGALIEFSRAIHAEMDALLSLTREPGASSRGTTLFSTTYPCHSCARHIVAAGVTRVVYIEPYSKSLALELHGDAIQDGDQLPPGTDGEEERKKIPFQLFTGFAPRRFSSLFEKKTDVKEPGTGLYRAPPTSNTHLSPSLTGSFLTLEEMIAKAVNAELAGGMEG